MYGCICPYARINMRVANYVYMCYHIVKSSVCVSKTVLGCSLTKKIGKDWRVRLSIVAPSFLNRWMVRAPRKGEPEQHTLYIDAYTCT
jgi:hypothetical protein